jgi:hypothetical protein
MVYLVLAACVLAWCGVVAFCGWLGWRIGEEKGHAAFGLWCGVFFGPVGLIILSAMPVARRRSGPRRPGELRPQSFGPGPSSDVAGGQTTGEGAKPLDFLQNERLRRP